MLLRVKMTKYGKIAREGLADWLLNRLKTGTKQQQEDAAARLQDLFERIVRAKMTREKK